MYSNVLLPLHVLKVFVLTCVINFLRGLKKVLPTSNFFLLRSMWTFPSSNRVPQFDVECRFLRRISTEAICDNASNGSSFCPLSGELGLKGPNSRRQKYWDKIWGRVWVLENCARTPFWWRHHIDKIVYGPHCSCSVILTISTVSGLMIAIIALN